MPKDIAKRFGVPACPPKSGDFRDGRNTEGVIEMDLYQIANTLFPGAPKNDPRLAAFGE